MAITVSLPLIWEVEPGRRILPAGSLPEITPAGFDPPEHLAAFLDAVRWSAVTSADVKTLQAPLRSGVIVEEYQLEQPEQTVAGCVATELQSAWSRRRWARLDGAFAVSPTAGGAPEPDRLGRGRSR
jgi:hypothetical protein